MEKKNLTVETLMELVSEDIFKEAIREALFEEAIIAVNNKIKHKVEMNNFLSRALEAHPDDCEVKQALANNEIELKKLYSKKDVYIKLQILCEINYKI